ncbi:MAG TPA: M56 family metallopeptidase [Thermoanaerobaculia bacterium]|nr:M56 family metallopeptidase [Thermoanaerobaculia bacterium]
MEILATAIRWAAPVLAALGRASLSGAVAVTVVWLVCRLFPRLPAGLRCGLWWLACLKLLVALVWAGPVALPVLPATAQEVRDLKDIKDRQYQVVPGAAVSVGSFKSFRSLAISSPVSPWPLALAGLWGAGLLLQLGLTARQLALARLIVRSAEPVGEPWISALFAALRERLGIRRAMLLASAEVETPQVSGAWRPRVLLPRRAIGRLSAEELSLTLGHELLHVRRGDLWLGWIPALAERLFFFHPLVALAAREYAVAREAACDAAVLRLLDPAPEDYGRLLLRLGIAPRVSRMAAAGAAPTFKTLKRRLEMLQQSADNKKRIHPGWWGLLALLALAVLIPIRIVVAQTSPEPPGTPVAVPPAPPAVAAIPAPGEPAGLPAVHGTHRGVPPTPPAPPVPPTPPVPPVPPARDKGWMSFGEDGEPWVLVQDEKAVTMSGNTLDVHRAREHYSGKPILWFRRDGKSYLIRDEATVARAQALFEPQRKLGEQQGVLGDQQGKLGDQQGRLGGEMGRYGARIGALASQQAGRALSGRDREDHDENLDSQMKELSDKMEALGRQMEALGKQQEELGRQQEALGRQQEQLAHEGERQLKSLLDQALASGLAKQVKE